MTEVRDESDRQGIRVVVDLRRDARHISVLNQLFKYTSMQATFGANMLALVDRQPRTLTLKQFLSHYIHHREIVITRRTQFDLRKAEARNTSWTASPLRWTIWTPSSRLSAGRKTATPPRATCRSSSSSLRSRPSPPSPCTPPACPR